MIFNESQKQLEEDTSDFLLNESAKQRIPKNLEDLNYLNIVLKIK